jgi:hypothetical protein
LFRRAGELQVLAEFRRRSVGNTYPFAGAKKGEGRGVPRVRTFAAQHEEHTHFLGIASDKCILEP